jgi:signal transduction histidine kinase
MEDRRSGSAAWLTGLSARLLILTIFFVMLSEVFIYAPSIGRYRLVYMQERIAAAHLASLALDAPGDHEVGGALMTQLLDHARSHGIVLRRPASKAMMLSSNMPLRIDATYSLSDHKFFPLIWEAFLVMARDGNRIIRVVGKSPKDPAVLVETVIDERPMRLEMYDYSSRILLLSIVISLLTASLVYLSLHWMFVRPMQGITENMVAFRADPEDAGRVITPGGRRDEIGRAQRELADMQSGLRTALQQRERLAALGTAVTKINHDLRNILATAQLVSDTVESSDDPKVRRVAPTLLGAIDRAVRLCSQTLVYAHGGTPSPHYSDFDFAGLIDEVGADAAIVSESSAGFDNGVPPHFQIRADRDQIYRVLYNLVRNAYEANASNVSVAIECDEKFLRIEISDDGPGLPAKIRETLFQPFSGSGRSGGTGLGLAIVREIVRGHGGNIELSKSGPDGSLFTIELPASVAFPAGGPNRLPRNSVEA